jgi:tetratricopeptide (TPR) repeat protein
MQFISGHSLAGMIAELRRMTRPNSPKAVPVKKDSAGAPTIAYPAPGDGVPALSSDNTSPTPRTAPVAALSTIHSHTDSAYFRTVAKLGIQAAEALDHAHQLGIVHRDVKPANLLVDASGRLWVTDFGLARLQNETSLSMTGDLIGTLRYMSPEQALAKRVVVDHHTDIYSLGVTLYELLTLQPPFTAEDRQELLREIAFEEPRLLRRINKSIPAELETIVLKAMEKNPANRYETAQALADDLHRFVLDEPIRARRPTLGQRARRWARRHRTLVGAAAAVLLTALIASGAGLWMWQESRLEQRYQAQRTRESVESALEQLPKLYERFLWDDAQAMLDRADKQLGTTGPEDLLDKVAAGKRDTAFLKRLDAIRLEIGSVTEAGALPVYKEAFLGNGFDVLEGEPDEVVRQLNASSVREYLLAALDNWAMTDKGAVGKRILALTAQATGQDWRTKLLSVWTDGESLARCFDGIPESQRSPAIMEAVGVRLNELGQDGVSRLERALRRYPNDFWLHFTLSWTLGVERHDARIGASRAALALRPSNAESHNNLGNALKDKGQLDDAIDEYREAIRLTKDEKDLNLPLFHCNLGQALHQKGQVDDAIDEHRKAIRLKKDFAGAYNELGNVLRDKGQLNDAIDEYREALRLKKDYAGAQCNLGLCLLWQGRYGQALVELRKGHELGSKAGWSSPSDIWVRQAEILAKVEPRIPDLIKGIVQPADADENLAMAVLCQVGEKLFARAVRFYRNSFAFRPALAEDLRIPHRYNAACAAVLAGCGEGKDADQVSAEDRTSFRQQALTWLKADLAANGQLLDKEPSKACREVQGRMQLWQQDPDLASVRAKAISKLPEAECFDWQRFWDKVEALRKRAADQQ